MIQVIAVPAMSPPNLMVVRLVFGEAPATRGSVIANYHPDDLKELELLLELGRRYEQRYGGTNANA